MKLSEASLEDIGTQLQEMPKGLQESFDRLAWLLRRRFLGKETIKKLCVGLHIYSILDDLEVYNSNNSTSFRTTPPPKAGGCNIETAGFYSSSVPLTSGSLSPSPAS